MSEPKPEAIEIKEKEKIDIASETSKEAAKRQRILNELKEEQRSIMLESKQIEKDILGERSNPNLGIRINNFIRRVTNMIEVLAFIATGEIWRALNLSEWIRLRNFINLLKTGAASTVPVLVGLPFVGVLIDDIIKTIREAKKGPKKQKNIK